MSVTNKKKLLFFAEAITLAHVARPLALSAGLDEDEWEVEFAAREDCHWLLKHTGKKLHPLNSISSASFLQALAKGDPIYDSNTLIQYVNKDLELLRSLKPDLVVGDFRLSLSISAHLENIPYINISNIYWSPYWEPSSYPVPCLPLTRILPISVATKLFRLVRPLAFALHCQPMNRARKHFGLAPLGQDLRRIYTDGNTVVYADSAVFFPDVNLPQNHKMLGPVIWSPPVSPPDWWETLDQNRPTIYLTLGSSGQANLLPHLLRALAPLDANLMVATAGINNTLETRDNIYVSHYLPGLEAAKRADIVICNGGSPTCHQALSAGKPVIGIPSNLDQFLNMSTLESYGVGATMRSDRFNGDALFALTRAMLDNDQAKTKAFAFSKSLAAQPSAESTFAQICAQQFY